MLIKLFKRNRKKSSRRATNAINYCMGDKDSTGTLRCVEPELVFGDIQLMKDLDEVGKQYSNPVSSGVISFRDMEHLSDKEIETLINDFREVMYGTEMKDLVNDCFIIHRDKGNLEIHFVAHNFIYVNDKAMAFNPFKPGHERKVALFCALKNDELGFDQIRNNGLSNKSSDHKESAHIFNNLKLNSLSSSDIKKLKYNSNTHIEIKEAINNLLDKKIMEGEINSKDELVEYIINNNLEIESVSDNYIVIKDPLGGGRDIKIDGVKTIKDKDWNEVKDYISKKEGDNKLSNDKKNYIYSSLRNIMKNEAEYNAKTYKIRDRVDSEFLDRNRKRINLDISKEKDDIGFHRKKGNKEEKGKGLLNKNKDNIIGKKNKDDQLKINKSSSYVVSSLSKSGDINNKNKTINISDCDCREDSCPLCFPELSRSSSLRM